MTEISGVTEASLDQCILHMKSMIRMQSKFIVHSEFMTDRTLLREVIENAKHMDKLILFVFEQFGSPGIKRMKRECFNDHVIVLGDEADAHSSTEYFLF